MEFNIINREDTTKPFWLTVEAKPTSTEQDLIRKEMYLGSIKKKNGNIIYMFVEEFNKYLNDETISKNDRDYELKKYNDWCKQKFDKCRDNFVFSVKITPNEPYIYGDYDYNEKYAVINSVNTPYLFYQTTDNRYVNTHCNLNEADLTKLNGLIKQTVLEQNSPEQEIER